MAHELLSNLILVRRWILETGRLLNIFLSSGSVILGRISLSAATQLRPSLASTFLDVFLAFTLFAVVKTFSLAGRVFSISRRALLRAEGRRATGT